MPGSGSKIFFGLVLVIVAVTAANGESPSCTDCGTVIQNHYEEELSYSQNRKCKPSTLDTGIQCSNIGPEIKVQGDLYANSGLHYVPLASVYYIARFADAWGYQNRCPTNTTFLSQLNMEAPWSGIEESIAVDGACGYKVLIREKCTFPNAEFPFLCTGFEGTPGTYGRRLETLSYISILQGTNLRWTLFANCWRPRTPQNPNNVAIATSFNVFSLDPKLTDADRKLVISELENRGFNTDPSNLIEFDYSSEGCR